MTAAPGGSRLRIKLPAQPLSPAGGGAVIESDASRQLKSELARYLRGEIQGRSFLIAGHRGAGKTMTVRYVVETLNREFRGLGLGSDIRQALYVPLHGPGMLSWKERAPKEERIREVLDRTTSGLYVAAAEEIANDFARYCPEQELVAQVRVELDQMPNLATLRELWSRAGVLESGILFGGGAERSGGADEIEALVSAWKAMKQFVGQGKQEIGSERSAERSESSGFNLDSKTLVPALAGLLTGLSVWKGLGGQSNLADVLTGAASGLAAAMGLAWSASQKREDKTTLTEKFEFNQDPKALYRILPVLVRRFCRMGLYPVFVVDELDKVAGLDTKVRELLGYLKQFVTEHAFFCFLTDRGYFHGLEWEGRRNVYSRSYTQFGDRLYVRYDAAAMRRYMDALVTVEEPEGDDENARAVLPLVLMQRSGLHPYDLRRQVVLWTEEDGRVTQSRTSSDIWNRQEFRMEVVIEVALEAVLRDARLAGLMDDPLRAQVLQDALLLPVRRWRDGEMVFSLTREELRKKLLERAHVWEDEDSGLREARIGAPTDADLLPDSLLTEVESRMQELLRYLANPPLLVPKLKDLDLPPAIEQIVANMAALVEVVE